MGEVIDVCSLQGARDVEQLALASRAGDTLLIRDYADVLQSDMAVARLTRHIAMGNVPAQVIVQGQLWDIRRAREISAGIARIQQDRVAREEARRAACDAATGAIRCVMCGREGVHYRTYYNRNRGEEGTEWSCIKGDDGWYPTRSEREIKAQQRAQESALRGELRARARVRAPIRTHADACARGREIIREYDRRAKERRERDAATELKARRDAHMAQKAHLMRAAGMTPIKFTCKKKKKNQQTTATQNKLYLSGQPSGQQKGQGTGQRRRVGHGLRPGHRAADGLAAQEERKEKHAGRQRKPANQDLSPRHVTHSKPK